jgi:hypothetical protein
MIREFSLDSCFQSKLAQMKRSPEVGATFSAMDF